MDALLIFLLVYILALLIHELLHSTPSNHSIEDVGNGNSSHQYDIEIDDEIRNLHLFGQRLPQGDYYVLRIDRSPGGGPPAGFIRQFPRELFLPYAFDMVRDMFSLSCIPLLPSDADRFARQIADYASNAAQHHDFAASRLLPINVRVIRTTTYQSNDHVDRSVIERAVRESSDAFRTVPATKSSVEALEEVGTLESQHICVICMEDLLPYWSVSLGLGCDEDDDNDDNDHRKLLKLPCSHVFHKDCIVRWFQTNHLCPLCRYTMPT